MSLDPAELMKGLGAATIPLFILALVMGALYMVSTMLAGASTLRYAIVGFYGRRGHGKSFSQVYFSRKWASKYGGDVWTNMSRLDLPDRRDCRGEPRNYGVNMTSEGRKRQDAALILRHHVHNWRDCSWCEGKPHSDGSPHGWEICCGCDIRPCDNYEGEPGQRGYALTHLDCEYLDFAHAYEGLCVIDEAGQIYSSTMWGKLPYASLKFLADTRKRRLLMFYSAHTPARVSKNLRELTDESFHCTSYKGVGMFKLMHFEGCLEEADQPIFVPFLPDVQKRYDTEEIIAPPGGLVGVAEAVGRREVSRKTPAMPEAAESAAAGDLVETIG